MSVLTPRGEFKESVVKGPNIIKRFKGNSCHGHVTMFSPYFSFTVHDVSTKKLVAPEEGLSSTRNIGQFV